MPTYQYACTSCEHRFDAVQAFTDATLTECPECSGRLRKLYGSVGVVFKGSGFYRTDSRKGNGDKSASTLPANAQSDSGSKSDSNGGGSNGGGSDSGASDGSSSKGSGAKESGSKNGGSRNSGSQGAGSNSSASGNSTSAAKAAAS